MSPHTAGRRAALTKLALPVADGPDALEGGLPSEKVRVVDGDGPTQTKAAVDWKALRFLARTLGPAAVAGGATGALTGAVRGGEGHRMEGAIRGGIGGAAGGAIGAGLGTPAGVLVGLPIGKGVGPALAGGAAGYGLGALGGGYVGGRLASPGYAEGKQAAAMAMGFPAIPGMPAAAPQSIGGAPSLSKPASPTPVTPGQPMGAAPATPGPALLPSAPATRGSSAAR